MSGRSTLPETECSFEKGGAREMLPRRERLWIGGSETIEETLGGHLPLSHGEIMGACWEKWEDGRSWGRKLEERPTSGARNHGILCSAPALRSCAKRRGGDIRTTGAANQACSESLEADCAEQPSSGGTGCMRATDIIIQSGSFPGHSSCASAMGKPASSGAKVSRRVREHAHRWGFIRTQRRRSEHTLCLPSAHLGSDMVMMRRLSGQWGRTGSVLCVPQRE